MPQSTTNVVRQGISNPVPSESDIREILAKMLETNPSQIPVVLLQIQFERFMLKVVDILRNDLEPSVKADRRHRYFNSYELDATGDGYRHDGKNDVQHIG